jgi:hypothetical protein
MAPDGDVRVLEDTERCFTDGTVLRVRVLAVPESEKFPDGVKYRLHYGTEDGETLIRYDNSHGVHERHTPDGLDEDSASPAMTPSKRASGPRSNGCARRGSHHRRTATHDTEHAHRDR